jgi:bifunctional non-homologous end joining protein LigD
MSKIAAVQIPRDVNSIKLAFGGRSVQLTNLQKPFWPELRISKGDLLRYYAAVSPVLLPHLVNRAMVMKRYPNGIAGDFFFMKRAPEHRPDWLEICTIAHRSGNVIDFPVVADLASLLWIVNLGCIDLNPWYARCDDINRPDYLHFDLDPVPPADFSQVRDVALLVRDYLLARNVKSYPKTTGSKGIHIYVPIVRGPLQKEVWTVAKRVAIELAKANPKRVTSEYRITKRPAERVLVDYNQNAWGRTLASVYSVRAKPEAAVSAPLTWEEVEKGISIADFGMKQRLRRVETFGDLFKPLLAKSGRTKLEALA